MQTGASSAVVSCLAIACTYVGLLYVWRGKLPRDHPKTIKYRILSTVLACGVSWIPAFWSARLHETQTPVHLLLGLRWTGLVRAVVDSLYLCVTLFAGPLVFFWLHSPPSHPHQPVAARAQRPTAAAGRGLGSARDGFARSGGAGAEGGADADCGPGDGGGREQRAGAGAGGGGVAAWLRALWLTGGAGDLRAWRNIVFAPLTEEFVFRACMIPLLKLEGLSSSLVVLLTPLFFGAAHLHHLAELVRHQLVPVRSALIMVAFQLVYTTVFGWLAAYLFLRTGHLAAPVAAHVFCNWAGFPPFGDMLAHPRAIMLVLTTLAGVVAFGMALPRMTAPERHLHAVDGGW